MGDSDLTTWPPCDPESFRKVFSLADELVERINDDEVEERLRHLLHTQGTGGADQPRPAPPGTPSTNSQGPAETSTAPSRRPTPLQILRILLQAARARAAGARRAATAATAGAEQAQYAAADTRQQLRQMITDAGAQANAQLQHDRAGHSSPPRTRTASPLADLICRAARDDEAACRELIERYMPLVLAVAKRCGLNRGETEEIIGRAIWLRLAENLRDIREPKDLPLWLTVTVQREAMHIRRLAGRQGQTGTGFDQRLGPLNEIPARYSELLLLISSDEALSYQEIAELLDIPVGSVGPTRARGLSMLSQSLCNIAHLLTGTAPAQVAQLLDDAERIARSITKNQQIRAQALLEVAEVWSATQTIGQRPG